ncbi:MAG: alanine dehydrogenase [Deltaproteobacteria bacterium]|nr:alanine dehydrogenase [Deltaproteobacteria bacterium]
MVIGVPKEIKDKEFRVAVVPSGVRVLIDAGHRVLIERGAGSACGITDDAFVDAGAEIVDSPEELYGAVEMVVKVKEPLPEEYPYLREGLLLFTFLHLAPLPELTDRLVESGCTAIAYETVELPDGSLPLLTPMSEVAGRISVQVGACYLMGAQGGRGILLGGVPGVERGRVAILGGGTVGRNAARIAVGMGAEVTILNRGLDRLRSLDDLFGGRVETLQSNPSTIERVAVECDLLVGAVLVTGARAPKLVMREMVSQMKSGAVIVDVSVDQGGCVETLRPTTHSDPVYEVDGVIHYGVTNMPGAVPRTSTFALTNATLPYLLTIANLGFARAVSKDDALARGVNVCQGQITCPAVAEAQGKVTTPLEEIIQDSPV